MGVAAETPIGGITAQLGERSFPLLLRNGEIERFEEQHGLGIYALLDQLIQRSAQARHVRDVVALGLIGAGMSDRQADQAVASLPPKHNFELLTVARDLVLAAFVDPEKKSDDIALGLADQSVPTDSTPPDASATQSEQA